MVLVPDDADTMAGLIESIKEDMMLALLGELQGVATVCAKVCVQRLQEMHEGMLPMKEGYEGSEFPCKCKHHRSCSADAEMVQRFRVHSNQTEVDGSAALEAMYEDLELAGAGKLQGKLQNLASFRAEAGCATKHSPENPSGANARGDCRFSRVEEGADTAAGLAVVGSWQPLPPGTGCHADQHHAAQKEAGTLPPGTDCHADQHHTAQKEVGTLPPGTGCHTDQHHVAQKEAETPPVTRPDEAAGTAPVQAQPASARQQKKVTLPGSPRHRRHSAAPAVKEGPPVLQDSELLMWLPLSNTADSPLTEAVSGKRCDPVGPEPEVVRHCGRAGLNFTGACQLQLPRPIELGANWTISFWMFSPMDTEAQGQEWKYLLDGPTSCRPVLLHHDLLGGVGSRTSCTARRMSAPTGGGDLRCRPGAASCAPIGNVSRPSFTKFRVGALHFGWHHVAVVGTSTRTTYFVDGDFVGHIQTVIRGTISAVGNNSHQHDVLRTSSWGRVSDLRVFGVAADAGQIRVLARQ